MSLLYIVLFVMLLILLLLVLLLVFVLLLLDELDFDNYSLSEFIDFELDIMNLLFKSVFLFELLV